MNFLQGLIASFFALLASNADPGVMPTEIPSHWRYTKWERTEPSKRFMLTASSEEIVNQCLQNPAAQIEFPMVFYSAHEIFLNEQLLYRYGSPDMSKSNDVLSAPVLPCNLVTKPGRLTWKAYAYSDTFARIGHFPLFKTTKTWVSFFGETLYVGGAIGLILLATFAFSILSGKESIALTWSLVGSAVFCALYMLGLVLPEINIDMPMVEGNRYSDFSLLIGIFLLINFLKIEGLVPRWAFRLHACLTVVAMLINQTGRNGDEIQNGTTLPFLSVVCAVIFVSVRLSYKLRRNPSVSSALMLLFGIIFSVSFIYEMALFTGSISGYSYLPIGLICSFLTIILSVNQRIRFAYEERDDLRRNLEQQVKDKTAHLTQALSEKEFVQAELIQSAKLVSLGTLSAGIAHEINNSINYINGAVVPLERLVMKEISETKAKKVQDLFRAVKDGAKITTDIVTSLRNFTGLNQAPFKDMNLRETVDSVLTILRNKLRDKYVVENNIPSDLHFYGNIVGWNQVFMNLISNSIDAMPDGGTIKIGAAKEQSDIKVFVQDTGSGIEVAIVDRIFDPFFTTKDVGKGTGLGLHIVKKEIDRHKGSIKVISKERHGTIFEIRVPTDRKEAA